MKYLNIMCVAVLATLMTACGGSKGGEQTTEETEQVVNVYTHRHYDPDKELFAKFTEETGIKVNVVSASADELINKLEQEGEQSPADVLITVDAGRLYKAKNMGLLQKVSTETLSKNVPAKFADPDGQWYGLTFRGRVVAYSKERVQAGELSTYENLTDPKWQGKVLIRSSSNLYNQSLLASIIASQGEEAAAEWAAGMVANFAREPKGNDRDQVKAIAAGEGDLAVVNTYYIGKLLTSDNPEEVKAGEAVNIFFPNQDGRGAHINVSGAGVTKYAPNKDNAIRFIEYLSSPAAQSVFAEANFEYPVHPEVPAAALLQSWGEFKTDSLDLNLLGEYNEQAVKIFDEAGWK